MKTATVVLLTTVFVTATLVSLAIAADREAHERAVRDVQDVLKAVFRLK